MPSALLLLRQSPQEIGEAFDNPDDRAFQLIAHAATGCVAGAVATGNCGAGAAGQVVGELAALAYRESLADDIKQLANSDASKAEINAKIAQWQENGVDLARLSGAVAAAVAGGNSADVNAASDAAGTAAANNALPLLLVLLAAASVTYTTVDVANIYITEGPEAALQQLAIDGAITIVGAGALKGAYKVGGVIYKNAPEAYAAAVKHLNLPTVSSAGLLSKKLILFKGDEAVSHFDKHADQLMRAFNRTDYNLKDYIQDANHVINEGQYVPELNGYVKLISGEGSAKYGFVGLDRTTEKITTFHVKTVSELAKKAPSLGISK